MSLQSRLLDVWDMFMEMLSGYVAIGRLNLSPQLIPVL
jgi:hypothetical protein